MAGALLQRRLHHPHPVQFVTRKVRVDVAGLQDVAEAIAVAGQFVAVVGDVDFPLAHQLPVVPVRRAVVHVRLVVGALAVGAGAGVVVADVGGTPDAALSGVVDPGLARLRGLVQGLVNENERARQSGRGQHLLQEIGELVVDVVGGGARLLIPPQHLLPDLHHAVGAGRGGCGLTAGNARGLAAVAQKMVPDGFKAVLGNRKGDALGGVHHTVAVLGEHRRGGVGDGPLVDARRQRGRTSGLVDRHPVCLGIALDHRDLAGREVGLVFPEIVRRDGEERLVVRERVDEMLAAPVAGRRLLDAAFPRGYGAGFVARPGGPQRRQLGAQSGGLRGRDLGRRWHRRDQRHHERGCLHGPSCLHVIHPLRDYPRCLQTKRNSLP